MGLHPPVQVGKERWGGWGAATPPHRPLTLLLLLLPSCPSWSLWLAILLTIMVVPFCVVVVEFLAVKRHIARSDWLPGLREASVRTLWTLMT